MATTREFHIVENYRPDRRIEAHISEEQLTKFAEDGFIVLERAFDSDECKALAEATERVATAEQVAPGPGGVFLRHLMDKDETFLNLLYHPLFLPIARLMLGPMVRALPVTARIAYPGEPNQAVDWHIHQRLVPVPMPPFFSLPVVLDTLIYLDGVDAETGPLQVVPGSHLRGDVEIPSRNRDLPGQLTLMPKAGDAIMMHGNVWHRALPTTLQGRRRRLIIFPFGQAWANLPSFGTRPEGGLLDQLMKTADPDLREVLGDCERLYKRGAAGRKR